MRERLELEVASAFYAAGCRVDESAADMEAAAAATGREQQALGNLRRASAARGSGRVRSSAAGAR